MGWPFARCPIFIFQNAEEARADNQMGEIPACFPSNLSRQPLFFPEPAPDQVSEHTA